VTPCRNTSSRAAGETVLPSGSRTLTVGAGAPAAFRGCKAVSFNFTVATPSARARSFFPESGPPPTTATVDFKAEADASANNQVTRPGRERHDQVLGDIPRRHDARHRRLTGYFK